MIRHFTNRLQLNSKSLQTVSLWTSIPRLKKQEDYLPAFEIPTRVERPSESLENKRRRLVYQSRKRGILESDLLCSTFVEKYLDGMSEREIDTYDRLLDENDWDLYYWAAGEREIPDRLAGNEILLRMRDHFQNEGRRILRMPKLLQKE